MRKRRRQGAQDYFLAGRGLTWWLVGFSLIAANISTEQFVGMSGKAADWLGMAIASYEWMAAITLVVVAFVFLPNFLKSGIYTIPEFLEYRYNSFARTFMAIATMVILVGVPTASVIFSGAKVITVFFQGQTLLGLDLGSITVGCWIIGLAIRNWLSPPPPPPPPPPPAAKPYCSHRTGQDRAQNHRGSGSPPRSHREVVRRAERNRHPHRRSRAARELVDLIIGQRPQDALVHLEELLNDAPDNSELLAMQAQAIYKVKGSKDALNLCLKLVGYDKASKSFDPEKASVKDRPEVYALLAGLIMERDQDQEFAQQVVEEMIALNPDSADAHLKRSVFLRSIGENEEANLALQKAYELDPASVEVARQKGSVAFEEEDFAQAESIFRTAMEANPKNALFYDLLARVLIQQEKLDEALAMIESGEKMLGDKRAMAFAQLKLNVLFQQADFTAVERLLTKIDRSEDPALKPFVDFTRARMTWQQQKWSEAARQLARVQPKLLNFPQEQAMAGALLATCYERQGKNDLARQAYSEVLEKFPKYEAAKRGLEALQQRINPSTDEGLSLDQAINEMAAKPVEMQDWAKVEAMVEKLSEERDLGAAGLKLLQSQIMMKRGKYNEAKELIRQAALLDPEDIRVRYAAIGLLLEDPEAGPAQAEGLLDKLEAKFGDSPRARVTRASIVRTKNEANVLEALDQLTENIDQWSPEEQAQIEASIALQFEMLKNFDKAKQHWNRAIEIMPDSLPMRMHLYDMAFQQRDIPGMLAAEQLILDLVKDENDGNLVLCQARRTLLEYTMQEATREDLIASRQKLDAALKCRPEWHELHVLYGQLLLLLEEDNDLALQHLNDALKYGPPNPNAVSLQVKLLAQRGNFAEAGRKMELIPASVRMQVLNRAQAEVLLQNGEKELAFEAAQNLAAAEPENASTQAWFAGIAQQTDHFDVAATALNQATELNPSDADMWMQLLSNYAMQKDNDKIEDTLRRAQLAVEADFLPLLIAKKLELMGDWSAAEKIYLANFSPRMDELPILQRMAEFYFLWSKQGKVAAQQASPYINRMLKKAYEGEVEPTNPYIVWARDRAARLLAGSGDYQQSLKARKLLNPSGDPSQLSVAEQTLLAEIYASRGEPESQLKAIELLSSLERKGQISKDGMIALARLLGKSGDWEQGQQLMLDALTKYGDDEQVSATFVDILVDNDQFILANNRLDSLARINPDSPMLMPLSVKLAAKSGDQSKLQKLLQGMLPKNFQGALDQNQLNNMLAVARMATENDQIELAAQIYPVFVQRTNTVEAVLEYARFLALHGDPSKAMEIINQVFPKRMEPAIQVAVSMLRERRADIGDKFDEEVNELIARSLRDDPESVQRMIMKAEALEVQGKYDESIAAYEQILNRDDVPRMMRAAARNNLGFVLASTGQRVEEAQTMIDQAVDVYGPSEDILDTRAVVRMAGKNYDGAVEDMTLATRLSRDPIKFFHLAVANMLAGNTEAALDAWGRAQQLGITKEKLPLMEQPDFERIRGEIEGLRTQNAKL